MKKNKIFGVLGIGAYMSNPNADFTGYPREVGGRFIMSPMAVKYPIRKYWDRNGENVLFFKSMKLDGDNFKFRTLEERFEYVLGVELNKKTKKRSKKETYKNLFKFIDVVNFGSAFAVEGVSIHLTGAVQFGDAVNLYDNAEIVDYQILSPFLNKGEEEEDKEKEKDATTLGTRKVVDEGHYFAPFSINPFNYKDIYQIEGFEDLCYTEEAYKKFKEACLCAHSEISTMSKNGMENEFAVFIEMKEGSKVSLPNLHNYIKTYKENDILIVDLEELQKLLILFNSDVNNIEVYLNDIKIKVKNFELVEYKKFNILNNSEI